MGFVNVNGVNWYYELNGPADAPVVALANGVFADTRNWQPQVVALATKYRVLTFDFHGQGKSKPLCQAITVAQQAQGFSAMLEQLKIKKIHYIGVSYGGEVGLTWAVQRPDQLQSLIVANSVATVHDALDAKVKAWLAALRCQGADAFYEVAAPDIFSSTFIQQNPKLMSQIQRGFQTLDLNAMICLLETYADYNLFDALHQITVPTLLIAGEWDVLKPPGVMQEMAHLIPSSEFLIVPEAGHATHMEKPQAFITACLGFLAKQEAL